MTQPAHEYTYTNTEPSECHAYLWPALLRVLTCEVVLEIGCGNGSTARMLAERGFDVCGVDPSSSAITQAASIRHPRAHFHEGTWRELCLGAAPLVVSLEVIEHVPSTREFMRDFADALLPGGIGVISTPYHGWLKTLAIVLAGRFDSHFNPLWEGGHLKFFTPRTLRMAAEEAGLRVVDMLYLGRVWPFSKSMMMVVTK